MNTNSVMRKKTDDGTGVLQALLLCAREGGAVHTGLHPDDQTPLRGLCRGGYYSRQGGLGDAESSLGEAAKVR